MADADQQEIQQQPLPFPCNLCDHSSENLKKAHEHSLGHKGFKFECTKCAHLFQDFIDYDEHYRNIHLPPYNPKHKKKDQPKIAAPKVNLSENVDFQCCSEKGCDASVLLLDAINGIESDEKEAPPNQSFKGFDMTELACPAIVSCSDILVLATRDAVGLAGGPLLTGRRDSSLWFTTEAVPFELPALQDDLTKTILSFSSRDFDERETISLLANGVFEEGQEDVTPPSYLMEHPPLAVFINGVSLAMNELRPCAPLSLKHVLAQELVKGLQAVSESLMVHNTTRRLRKYESVLYGSLCRAFLEAGGPFYPLLTGRRDSSLWFTTEAVPFELPALQDDLTKTLLSFSSRDFDERETISLLGILHADQQLMTYEGTANRVRAYASHATLFRRYFSMVNMRGKEALSKPKLKLSLPASDDTSFVKFLTQSGTFKEGNLLVNKDGVRIIPQKDDEAMWFLLHSVFRRGQNVDSSTDVQPTVQSLEEFIQTSTSIGEFKKRLQLLLAFHGHISSGICLKSDSSAFLMESSKTLYSIFGYYIQFLAVVLEHIKAHKRNIVGDLKQLLKLSLWECSAIYLSIETSKRTCQKLRKLNALVCVQARVRARWVRMSMEGLDVYELNFFQIGLIVLALHDASDAFMKGAKVFIYSEKQLAASVLFGFFARSWFILQLIFFPFWMIRNTSYDLIEFLNLSEAYLTFLYYIFQYHANDFASIQHILVDSHVLDGHETIE